MRKLLALLPVMLLLIAQVAIAQQDIVNTISNVLVQFSGVIFIIAFVIILLLIAGVLPRISIGGFGIPWGTIGLLIALLIVMVVPFFIDLEWLTTQFNVTLVQYQQSPLPSEATTVLSDWLGLPKEWMYTPAIIYFFILPFAAVFALIYAFLASLNIWEGKNNINRLLAFIITIMTIPTGILTRMTMVMFVFLGMWVLAVFFVTFVVGVFYRGAGVIAKERATYKAMRGPLRAMAESFRKYADRKIAAIGPGERVKQDVMRRTRDDIEEKIYLGEIKSLDEAKSKFDEEYKKIVGGG